jgi:hypothetical protein
VAETMLVTPGQVVAAGDWQALADQHDGPIKPGQPGDVRPPTKAELDAYYGNADLAGDWYADYQNNPIRRYYFKDGSFVEARQASNGVDYQIVAYQPSQKFQQQQTQAQQQAQHNQTPGQQAQDAGAVELNNEKSWNLAHGGLFETHADRRDREAKEAKENAPKTSTATVKGGDNKDYVRAVTINPDGSIAAIKNYDLSTGQEVASVPGQTAQPTVSIKEVPQPDGSTKNVRVISYPPDAAHPTGQEIVAPSEVPGKPAPEAKPPTERVNPADPSKRQRWDPKANGGQGDWVDAGPVAQAGAGIKNVEPFRPDPSDPNKDLGITAWAERQRQKIGQDPGAGGITKADYDEAVTEAHQLATAYANNIVTSQNAQRNVWLDAENQRRNLSQEASHDYDNGLSVFNQIWKYTKPGSRAIMGVIPGIVDQQARIRQERQQTGTPPPALHPMFQWTSEASAAQANGRPPPPPPPGVNVNAAPSSGAPTAPGVPAAEAGASAPPAPVTVPVGMEPHAAEGARWFNDPQSGERRWITPSGDIHAEDPGGTTHVIATPANPSENAALYQSANVPAAPPSAPPSAPDSAPPSAPTPEPGSVFVLPPSQQPPPTADDAAGDPQGMAGGMFAPMAKMVLGDQPMPTNPDLPPPDSGGINLPSYGPDAVGPNPNRMEGPGVDQDQINRVPPNPALAAAAQQARVPQFDPYRTAGWMADLGIPHESIAQAMLELGLVG